MSRPPAALVLGGSGFIGGAAVRRLRARGVAALTLHRGEGADVRGDRAELARHRETIARLAPDVVVDAIAYTEADGASLVAALRGIARRTVVLSSQDVYAPYGRLLGLDPGPPDRVPSREDSPLRTSRFPYRARAAGPGDMAWSYEKILVEEAASSEPALPATILRLPCVHGAGDRHHRVGQVLARLETRAPFLLDAAKARWRWTRGAVENVAEAIALAATDERAAGRVYNVGEEPALSESEWVRRIARAAEVRVEVKEVGRDELPSALREPYDFSHDLVADTTRIRAELGYREVVETETAVAEAVAWERGRGRTGA
jgi:nucleoside-diphosphate-sugar epimerase